MLDTIKVHYYATSDVEEASDWLEELSEYPIIGCDFEAASKYTPEDLEHFQSILDDPEQPHLRRMEARSKIKSNALSHPSHTILTHFSLAISDHQSCVFIIDSKEMEQLVLSYLITTEQTQVWHNAAYDFYHIYYRTKQFPKNYEDTRVYAKTLLNHVEINKALVGLKQLAGTAYGAWGISEDNFTIDQMYDDKMLLYAATDPCATLWIYNKFIENVETNHDN